MRHGRRLAFVAFALIVLVGAARAALVDAQSAAHGAPSAAGDESSEPPRLRVGVCQQPPYSFRQPDGTWDGMAVQLWKIAAASARVDFEWHPLALDEVDPALVEGRIDVAATGIPIVPLRLRRFDCSQPFEAAGMVIATRSAVGHGFLDGLRHIFSREVLTWLGTILGATLVAGVLIALLERRRNPQFPRGAGGIMEGIWWSITTLSTVGYGDRVPITHRGRLAAAVWMLIAFMLLTIFSGIIAASITVGRLNPMLSGPDDLPRSKVGVLAAGVGAPMLRELGVQHIVEFEMPDQVLDALLFGSIDAVVGESTSLRYLLQRQKYASLVILPHPIKRVFVGLGLSRRLSPELRAAIDQSVVETVESTAWNEYLQQLLGANE